MKNLKKIVFGAMLMAMSLGHAQKIEPLTQAMLNGYEELLRENPKDYQTLYQRAAEYYRLNLYDKALNDLAKAIQYTPVKEPVLLEQELTLMADINIELKEYEKALEAVNRALEIIPDSYADLYKKGNICLYLHQPEDAYRAFSQMQRLKSRSQEAFFGMAKANIMMGKPNEARELIKHAEDADPNNYVTFCRIGDLYEDLGENEMAATSYLSAYALSSGQIRPVESLVKIASKDYPAFVAAIDYAIGKTTNTVPLYYLKGSIALDSGYFEEAKSCFNSLISEKGVREAPVYSGLARACMGLDELGEALTNIDLAVIQDPTVDNYLL